MGSVISNQGQGQKSQCRWSPGSHGGGWGEGGGSAQTMSFLERVAAAGAEGGNSCDPLKSVLSFSFPNKAVHSRWQS